MTPFADLCLQTPRLVLRPLDDGDADDLMAIFGDAEVTRYWSTPAWTDPAQALALVAGDRAGHAERSALRFGLVLRPGHDGAATAGRAGRVVGTVSLFRLDATHRRAELGYALATRAQGHGLMHEALGSVVRLAFDTRPDAPLGDLALHRLEADIDPRNTASARVLARLGFRAEGVLRERWRIAGEVSDAALYGLLRPEWESARGISPPA